MSRASGPPLSSALERCLSPVWIGHEPKRKEQDILRTSAIEDADAAHVDVPDGQLANFRLAAHVVFPVKARILVQKPKLRPNRDDAVGADLVSQFGPKCWVS